MQVSFSSYLSDLESRRPEPGAAAFFDLDRTLIAGYSVKALGWEGFKRATVPRWRIALQLRVFFDYGLGLAHYLDLMRVTLSDLAGVPEPEFLKLGEWAFQNGLAGRVFDEGRHLIAAHGELGHTVVLLTSATRAQALPFARELGIGHLCCTELETVDGRISGAFEPCYGVSKREAARDFCASRKLALPDSWFYTDGIEDLPLLESVGRPVVVNPKSKLARVAQERAWPRLDFGLDPQQVQPSGRWRKQLANLLDAGRRAWVDGSRKGKAALAKRRAKWKP